MPTGLYNESGDCGVIRTDKICGANVGSSEAA